MRSTNDRGYAMAALLVGMSVMSIMLGMALPVWRTAAQREREAELIFRGQQYAQAIALYSRRTGGFPPTLDALEKGKFIRKLYKDPMTKDGAFQLIYFGQQLPGMPVVPGTPAAGAPGGPFGGAPGGGTANIRNRNVGGPGQAQGRGGQLAQVGSGVGLGVGQGVGAPGQPGAAAGPIIGVVSKSTEASLRLFNARGHYNEWVFVSTAATQQPGVPAGSAQVPGPVGAGRRGQGVGRGRGLNLPGRGAAPMPGRGVPMPGPSNPFGPSTSPGGSGR